MSNLFILTWRGTAAFFLYLSTLQATKALFEREGEREWEKKDRQKESIPDKILLFLHFSFGKNHPDHFIVLALPCQGRVLCWKHKNTSANHDHTQWACDLFKHPVTHFVPPVSKLLLALHQHKPLMSWQKSKQISLCESVFFSVSFRWYFGSFVCFFLTLCPCWDS